MKIMLAGTFSSIDWRGTHFIEFTSNISTSERYPPPFPPPKANILLSDETPAETLTEQTEENPADGESDEAFLLDNDAETK